MGLEFMREVWARHVDLVSLSYRKWISSLRKDVHSGKRRLRV